MTRQYVSVNALAQVFAIGVLAGAIAAAATFRAYGVQWHEYFSKLHEPNVNILCSATGIPKGHVIESSDIGSMTVRTSKLRELPDVFRAYALESVLGKTATTWIAECVPLMPCMLCSPEMSRMDGGSRDE